MTNYTWTGLSGDWSDITNWTASGNPASVDTAIFDGGSPVDVTGYAAPGNIFLDGAQVTLDGYFIDQPAIGQITDGAAQTSSNLTISAMADVVVSQLALADTNFVVAGGLVVDGGSANFLNLQGSEAVVGINNSLTVNSLIVNGGASLSGNITLGNGIGLHMDDQSTVAQGTVSIAQSSLIFVSSTINGGQEAVQFSDNVSLGANGTLSISGNPGVTVHMTGDISGSGTLATPGCPVAIDGTLTASSGTLNVGNLSGTGSLVVASGADLVLKGTQQAGLTAAFSGSGTMTIAESLSQFGATIANFAPTDTLIVPGSGATSAQFVATAPGAGVLTLLDGTQAVGQLKLAGVQAGETFNVAANSAGATVVTAAISTTTVQHSANISLQSGASQPTTAQVVAIAPYAQAALEKLVGEHPGGNNEWYLAGDTTVVGGAPSFGFDLEVVGPLTHASAATGFGPGANISLTAGYHALIAEGSDNINLFDTVGGGSLLVGNAGADTLVSYCNNDTLVGAAGANTVFYTTLPGAPSGGAGQNVCIQGGGNDTITTTNDNALIATSTGHSQLFLGSGHDTVVSNGHDEIACGGQSNSVISITTTSTAQDTVFGGQSGSVIFTAGVQADTLVGGGGAVTMTGGAGNGNELWAGASEASYVGGAGSAIVVGGSAELQAQGGAGAMTVWGGTGGAVIKGSAGASKFIVGEGASTVSAAAGNQVYVTGGAAVSVCGANGVEVYGGSATGNSIFQAASGSETLWGGQGDDTFIGGNATGGQSLFVSGGGSDVFSFTNGMTGGTNVIIGFVDGQDTISLNGYGEAAPTISVHDGSSFMTLGDGSHLVVYGVTDLTASAFHVS